MKHRSRLLVSFCAVTLGVAACGSDSDPVVVSTPESVPASDDASTPAENAPAPADQSSEPEEDGNDAPPPPGGATATVTLDNGDSYTFSILCNLQPQESAGSTILFTLVSYDDPVNLDVTQFGDDSFGGAANISLYDSSTYDTLWDASSRFENNVELSLDGSTVTGSGTFIEGEDGTGSQVGGELVANC
jgi:hypothetical protein